MTLDQIHSARLGAICTLAVFSVTYLLVRMMFSIAVKELNTANYQDRAVLIRDLTQICLRKDWAITMTPTLAARGAA